MTSTSGPARTVRKSERAAWSSPAARKREQPPSGPSEEKPGGQAAPCPSEGGAELGAAVACAVGVAAAPGAFSASFLQPEQPAPKASAMSKKNRQDAKNAKEEEFL